MKVANFKVTTEETMKDRCINELQFKMYEVLDKYYKDPEKEFVTNASIEVSFHNEDQDDILKYCQKHIDQMWAATIVSIVLGCDFRDSKQALKEYFNE